MWQLDRPDRVVLLASPVSMGTRTIFLKAYTCSQPYPPSGKSSFNLLRFLVRHVTGPKQPPYLANAVHLIVEANSDVIAGNYAINMQAFQ